MTSDLELMEVLSSNILPMFSGCMTMIHLFDKVCRVMYPLNTICGSSNMNSMFELCCFFIYLCGWIVLFRWIHLIKIKCELKSMIIYQMEFSLQCRLLSQDRIFAQWMCERLVGSRTGDGRRLSIEGDLVYFNVNSSNDSLVQSGLAEMTETVINCNTGTVNSHRWPLNLMIWRIMIKTRHFQLKFSSHIKE